jgi:hypothetical protein
MNRIIIEKQMDHKSDFTKTGKDNIDIWKLHLKEREHMLSQIANYRQKNRIRDWIELIFMLGFICYMLYDMYKAGDLDTIIKFLT